MTPPHATPKPEAQLSPAGRAARVGGEIAVASVKAITARTGLASAGMSGPANANHRELARIVPEVSMATALAAADQGGALGPDRAATGGIPGERDHRRPPSDRGDVGMPQPGCTGHRAGQVGVGVGMVGARVVTHSIALGTMVLRAQEAALAPFHRTATANPRRLG